MAARWLGRPTQAEFAANPSACQREWRKGGPLALTSLGTPGGGHLAHRVRRGSGVPFSWRSNGKGTSSLLPLTRRVRGGALAPDGTVDAPKEHGLLGEPRSGVKNVAHGASRGSKVEIREAPTGRERGLTDRIFQCRVRFCRPFGAMRFVPLLPTAYAVGYILCAASRL